MSSLIEKFNTNRLPDGRPTGWRAFRIQEEGLRSVVMGTLWEKATLVARRPPTEEDSCGIYSVVRPRDVGQHTTQTPIIGRVALGGRIVLGHNGVVRAERAEIIGLHVPHGVAAKWKSYDMQWPFEVLHGYGVPVELVTDYSKFGLSGSFSIIDAAVVRRNASIDVAGEILKKVRQHIQEVMGELPLADTIRGVNVWTGNSHYWVLSVAKTKGGWKVERSIRTREWDEVPSYSPRAFCRGERPVPLPRRNRVDICLRLWRMNDA